MFASVKSMGVSGVGGYGVTVEVNISGGMPAFDIVGLPDTAVKEARERVRAAIKNAGFSFPVSRLTVNLAPADRRKAGTVYDLPVLVAILVANGELRDPGPDCAFLGELSLTGQLRPVPGALPMAIAAQRMGVKRLFVPAENGPEAAFAQGLEVYAVDTVDALIQHLRGRKPLEPTAETDPEPAWAAVPDFSDVKGQENVKRAMEVAAAGGHNMLIIGPPGAGKSMMARRLPGILPDMSREEMIQCTEIYSVAGLTSRTEPVVNLRPFRSPHHTVSAAALAGGGTNPRPGEISLAHNGVLFLDELPEFHRDSLEVLRQPLEDGEVTVSRVAGTLHFPSRFMLVCAMNPCKCGWYGHSSNRCRCSEADVRRYHARISGPLLDRIDLIVEVAALDYEEVRRRAPSEPSAAIKTRVDAARQRQHRRFGPQGPDCNARMDTKAMRQHCALDAQSEELMRQAFETMGLTARSYDRILRVARTIADLDGAEDIAIEHVAEAVQYRTFEL